MNKRERVEVADKVAEYDYNPADDPEFHDQAKAVCMDLGIPEDEAELLVSDYCDLDLF